MLKPGDPCPCCGQPIKTSDPEILSLLTYILDSGACQESYNRLALAMVRRIGKGAADPGSDEGGNLGGAG